MNYYFISNTVLTFPLTTKEAQNHKREANFCGFQSLKVCGLKKYFALNILAILFPCLI